MEATVNPEAPVRATTRVQVELGPKFMALLRELAEETESASHAEVIRNALRAYRAQLDREKRNG